MTVDDAVEGRDQHASYPRPPHRPSVETILALVTGAMGSVGSVFVGTHSVLVTIIAAVAAFALATAMLIAQR
jgi:hypothetical protein